MSWMSKRERERSGNSIRLIYRSEDREGVFVDESSEEEREVYQGDDGDTVKFNNEEEHNDEL